MNRMEINGPGADFQIRMKKLLSGESTVNRVEANRAYDTAASFGSCLSENPQSTATQSVRWMDRYMLNLMGIKESDTITLRGTLKEYGCTAHSLGNIPFRPGMDMTMLEKQAELILEGTGLELKDYIDMTTRIRHYALRIPFAIQSSCITAEVDELENSYIITIRELEFKKKCNEVIRRFLNWWDGHMWQAVSPDILFLKRFCDLKSDRLKSEEQKQSAYELEQVKQEHTEEWEERTRKYVQETDWNMVGIGLGFVMVDPMGAALELCLEGMPENEMSKMGILIPRKLHFAELDQGIVLEKQLEYFPEEFKTRLLCAMVKHMNDVYKAKQPDFYEYKKWHTLCERRDFTMKFSRKFTYYSDEQLGIVKGSGISFAEWGRNIVPGGYEDLFEEN